MEAATRSLARGWVAAYRIRYAAVLILIAAGILLVALFFVQRLRRPVARPAVQ
jgi:hypothetical protein